jgi:hypothetical protein
MSIIKFPNDTKKPYAAIYDYICDPLKTDPSMTFTNMMISPLTDMIFLHQLNPGYNPKSFYKHIIVSLHKSDELNKILMRDCFKEIGYILSHQGQFPFVAAIHYKGDEQSGVGVHCHFVISKINHYQQKYEQKYMISTYKNTINLILHKYGFSPIQSYNPSTKTI